MVFSCSMCSFYAKDKDALVSHVCKIHRYDPNFLIYCSQCLRSFRVWTTYKKHLYRGCHGGEKETNTLSEDDDDTAEEDCTMDTSESLEAGSNDSRTIDPPQQWHSAKYILSVKERHTLSQCAVDCVVRSTTSLISSITTGILNELKINHDIPEDVMQLLQTKFQSAESSLFSGISTAYQQRKYFREEFNKVEPVSTSFGHRHVWKRGTKKHKRRLVKVQDKFQYVPVLDSLKALILKREVRDEIEAGHHAPAGILRDFCDGEFAHNHPLTKENPKILQIAIYFDDLETANPLGSKRGKHKLGMFYWMLLNIHPAHRSTLHSIQLLAVAKSADIRLYGIDAVLKPVLADLKILAAQGISVTLNDGSSSNYHGCLLAFLGDTPASALAGGFKEGVGGAYRCCSTCMITSSALDSTFDDTSLRLRNIDQHRRYCALLDVPDSSREYGVNRLSILDEAPYFDLCKCMPHDIMHVIFEGVLHRHFKFVLTSFIWVEHYFTLQMVNRLISEFEYGYTEGMNAPRPLDSDHLKSPDGKVSQSASQMWLLGRLLPLMLGKYVPDVDRQWKCYIQLLKIITISTAIEVTEDTVSVLSLLIRDYLEKFNSLYPNSITPKFHYLLHLPLQMQLFGPLRHQWCMRFEAKNAYVKSLIGKNFKNLQYTVAERQ